DNLTANQFAANVDLNFLSLICNLGGNIGHTDVFLQVRSRTSGSNFTDALAIDYDFLFVASNTSFGYFKSYQALAHADFFLFGQSVATDEVAFVQFTKDRKST